MAAAKKNGLTVSEADMAILNMIKSGQASKEKTSGLGFMWRNTTESVGEVFGTVAVAATATRVLAEAGLDQALQAKAESGIELLEQYGIKADGYDAVVAAKQLRNLLLGK